MRKEMMVTLAANSHALRLTRCPQIVLHYSLYFWSLSLITVEMTFSSSPAQFLFAQRNQVTIARSQTKALSGRAYYENQSANYSQAHPVMPGEGLFYLHSCRRQ